MSETASILWLTEDKTPGSEMKDGLLHRAMAVARVSAFLGCFPKPQFPYGCVKWV